MNEKDSSFIKLKVEEVTVKLQTIAENKQVVKIWTKGNESSFYRVSDLLVLKTSKGPEVMLSFFSEGEDRDQTLIGKKAFLSFTFNEIHYFAEGTMIKDESHDKIILRLDDNIYRSEKRSHERLITFPHHQVYAYFKIISDIDESNVISIHRDNDQEYQDLKVQRKEELKEKLAQRVGDVDNLVGFRALDISKNGIAFLVGRKEEVHFVEDKAVSFYILFNQEIFLIKGAQLVYKVDYLGGADSAKRYKIGLTFNPIDELSEYLAVVLKESAMLDSVQKDFEEFVDD